MDLANLPIPSTDVTNRGNEPGSGPLRSGGVEQRSITVEDNLPSTRSPRSERQLSAVRMCRDLWGGTETVRAAEQEYLPRAPGESLANYRDRLERSVFFNAFRRTVEGLTGLIFRKDIVLGDDVPLTIRGDENTIGHWENIDQEGTHGDVFCRDLEQDAIAAGHAAFLVEYPKASGQESRYEETLLNLRPYWVPIKKENILSWRTFNEGGALVLTQLVVQETHTVPSGMFGEREETRYRVFFREGGEGGAVVVGFVLLGVTEDKKIIQYDQGFYPTQNQIPVVEVKTSGSKGLFESDPPLIDLAYLNVAHYQNWSDYVWAAHKSNVPFLFGSGISQQYDENGQPKAALVVGANTAMMDPNADADMKYVGHDGAQLGSTKQLLDDLKADMGTLGLSMLSPQKRTAETAEAKRLDKSTSDSALSVSARCLQDATELGLYYHARYLGLDDGGSVTVNRDFEGLLMDAPVMSAYAQLVNAGFPPRVVLQALQEGGRIAEDADLDELEMEMMAGQAAIEAQKEMEREMLPDEPDADEEEAVVTG